MSINPLFATDFYKVGHIEQYPKGTQYIYSNFTPRASIDGDKYIIWFGLQYYIKSFLLDSWNRDFFEKPKDIVLSRYKHRIETSLNKTCNVDHIANLHELGYLPLIIRSLPEGAKVPIKVPVLTIRNTHPDFFWLPNYLETSLSCMLWKMTTSATTAYKYRLLLEKYAKITGANKEFIPFQAHDFSFRGMSSLEDAAMSGAGHLTCFKGTDTIPAINLLENYYYGYNTGYSVPATEHSVMCAGGQKNEYETFKRLITEVYPEGFVSIVSDTWDIYKVLNEYIPALKKEILARDGRVIIRPDSGDPVKMSVEVVDNLMHQFKVYKNDKGFKRMHHNLGVIYGDGITLERCESILKGLVDKKYSSDNMVFGVGSYTYQYKTRDTYGFAMKSTWGVINGKEHILFKDPVTDSGLKKSAKGILTVKKDRKGNYYMEDMKDYLEYEYYESFYTGNNELKTVFHNGEVSDNPVKLSSIRELIDINIEKDLQQK